MQVYHKKVCNYHKTSPPPMRYIYRRPPFDRRWLTVIPSSKFNLKRKKSMYMYCDSMFFSSEPCALPAIRNTDTTNSLITFLLLTSSTNSVERLFCCLSVSSSLLCFCCSQIITHATITCQPMRASSVSSERWHAQ